MSLGRFPYISLTRVRHHARWYRGYLADGKNPVELKQKYKVELDTFGQVADEWLEARKLRWSANQRRNVEHLLRIQCASLWAKPLTKINATVVHAALNDLYQRAPTQLRRALALCERILDYAKVKGHPALPDNPCKWKGTQEHLFPPLPKREQVNYPSMPYELVPDFLQTLRQRQARSTVAVCLEMIILTACRTVEASGAMVGIRF
jgi:integrase